MAISEMYNWLSVVSPGTSTTLDIRVSEVVEDSVKKQAVFIGDDGSEEYADYGTVDISAFYVTLKFVDLTEAEAGTIMDFYQDQNKGNGIIGTFQWTNNAEAGQYIYTVRFAEHLKRATSPPFRFDLSSIKLKVLGKPS